MTKDYSKIQSLSNSLTQAERDYIAKCLEEDNLSEKNNINQDINQEIVFHETIYTRYIKRVFDIVVALIALLLVSPINLVLFIVTFFDVGRPIFFRQERVGKDEKIFNIIKFRNMNNDVNDNGELLPAEQRVTKWGKIVRKLSLDELLNFWPVLKGDMSLIGPRPLTPHYLYRYSKRHRSRLKVKPGLECPPWKMINPCWDWEDRFENDVWYVENISFKVDVIMVIRLFQYAINKQISKKRADAKTGIFIGYVNNRAVSINQLDEEYIISCIKKYKEQ